MLKKLILGLSLGGMLWGCDTKEKNQLRAEVDSLRTELQTSQQMAQTLQDIGVLIDSIDVNRQLLRTDVVEGTNYANYTSRLQGINDHIKQTQSKLDELEKSLKSSRASASGYAGTIKRLKADLEERSQQLVALQAEVEKVRGENQMLAQSNTEKDSLLNDRTATIQLREQDIAALETHVEEINTQAKQTQADLYFQQALALETAAQRTKFAPRKKKETQREALELYKISLSLGKSEAQQKIDELEKATS